MTGTPLEIPQRPTGFAKSYGRRWTLLPSIQTLGRAMAAVRGGTSSRGSPSVWCTCAGATKSKSSPWPTVDDVQAIGGRDQARSNKPFERTAFEVACPVRAAAPPPLNGSVRRLG